MGKFESHRHACSICGKTFPLRDLVPGAVIRDRVVERIREDRPAWSPEGFVCREDLNRYRARYVHTILQSEKGELTALEQQVLNSLRDHEVLAKDVDAEVDQTWTLGERWADRIAAFGGSWTFLACFAAFVVVWIVINSAVLLWRPRDPYPFILLNLLLSCLAAVQAPIIMMSQNRQEAKDRLRARHDYQVNLKAELEIRQLNEKVDHLLLHQWERLAEIQEIQIELLAEKGERG
jgi:uncharacterized membrane protein